MKRYLEVFPTEGARFELRKYRMVEIDNFPWSAYRKSIARLFRTPVRAWTVVAIQNGGDSSGVVDAIRTTKTVQIGCKRFTGTDVRKLRKWALQ